jgi:hypothetical protein
MKKYKLFWIISAILTIIITLSSCSKVDSIDITFYYTNNADIENCSTMILPIERFGDESERNKFLNLKGSLGSIKIDNTLNYIGKVTLPLTAITHSKDFDIYAIFESGVEVKSFEVEVNNDVTLNGVECKKDNKYIFDASEKKESRLFLNVELKDFVTITFNSLIDMDNNKYNLSKYNEIRLALAPQFVKFSDDYKSFTIDTTNINLVHILIDGNEVNYEKDKYYEFGKNIKIVYDLKVQDDTLYSDRRYEIYDGMLLINFGTESKIIHRYETE